MTPDPMPTILRGDARALALPDASVDLIVTSPPYFNLRSYQDGGEHYAAQIGSEATPAEFIAALVECTREWMRVLKPSGSMFVNLGDKYDPNKSLRLLPERYRIACTDELGLIARAVIVWSKPNGLPESVTDRVRRSHEDWVHLTKAPRYFAAVDEIREQTNSPGRTWAERKAAGVNWTPGIGTRGTNLAREAAPNSGMAANPLGKLPGSVWEIPSQPLKVPAELGIDHFAAQPMEWPRRLITGWCPREVCTVCGEGRRPVVEKGDPYCAHANRKTEVGPYDPDGYTRNVKHGHGATTLGYRRDATLTGYACACPDTSAPSTPGVVLDPFGGTGTTALVATMLGRTGISVDLSADYCRLAEWRASDPKQRAKAAGLAPLKPPKRPAAAPAPVEAPALFDTA